MRVELEEAARHVEDLVVVEEATDLTIIPVGMSVGKAVGINEMDSVGEAVGLAIGGESHAFGLGAPHRGD